MARPTARELGRRLRRLDRRGLARFVAALWAAAGWSTKVRDGRVVARRAGATGQRLEILVLAGGADVGRRLLAPGVDADLLVAPVGERTAAALERRTGLEVVDAAALHERLTYGVEEPAREHLLAELVPDPTRTPSRRSVLSALAVGAGAAGSIAAATATDDPLWDPGSGQRSTSGAGSDDEQVDGDGAETPASGTPTDASATAAPPTGCETDPASRVAQQLIGLMQYLAPGGGTDLDGDGEIEYTRPETTDEFRQAVEEAGLEPISHAVTAEIGRPVEVGTLTIVPATVRTSWDDEFVYEFSVAESQEGCWRTVGAQIVARRQVGE